jgi:hypothetical protein
MYSGALLHIPVPPCNGSQKLKTSRWAMVTIQGTNLQDERIHMPVFFTVCLFIEYKSLRGTDASIFHGKEKLLEQSSGASGHKKADVNNFVLMLCLVPLKSALYKTKRFSITSNLRYIHRVLNVDKIKN